MLKRYPYWTSLFILAGLLFILASFIKIRHKTGWGLPEEGVIGVIEVQGPIFTAKPVLEQLEKMEHTEAVKGILLHLNSPGGGVAPAQEIYEALNRLRQKKKIYASMESVAASGAYYIACATDKVFANPGTITGSIGVIMEWTNLEELTQKVGAKMFTVKSGVHKDLMSMFRPMQESDQQILQGMVDDTYEQFIAAILQGRPQLEEAKLRTVADGRVFTGRQAKELALVDELGSHQQAIEALAKEVGLKKPIRVLRFDQEETNMLSLLGLAPLKELLPQFTGIHLSYLMR